MLKAHLHLVYNVTLVVMTVMELKKIVNKPNSSLEEKLLKMKNKITIKMLLSKLVLLITVLNVILMLINAKNVNPDTLTIFTKLEMEMNLLINTNVLNVDFGV